jgi:hypothetical protein
MHVFARIYELTMLCVCGSAVVMKLELYNRLQFSFGLTSSSLSDGPGIQDNIFDVTVTPGGTNSL